MQSFRGDFGVISGESVLFLDEENRLSLRKIESISDQQSAGLPFGCSAALGAELSTRETQPSLIKSLSGNRYHGNVYRVQTSHGRAVTVTAGQPVFIWRDRELVAKPAAELQVGDVAVVQREGPRIKAQEEIDLALLFKRSGQEHAVRIEGEAVRRLMMEKAVARQPAELRRDEDRVRLTREEWTRLSAARKAKGIIGAEMARRIGYRQACSISEFETCRSLPPVDAFQRYLDEVGEPWPVGVEIVASHLEQWAHGESKNKLWRKISSAVWLADLTENELVWLARQHDARGVILYPRAHRADAHPRFLEVSEDLCYVLGWYMAEGSLGCRQSRLNFSLGANDDPYLMELHAALRRVVGHEPFIVYPKDRPNSTHLYVFAPLFARLVKALGMGGNASAKSMPNLIFNCSEERQMVFLEGYFLGDGTKASKGNTITFGTSSYSLAVGLLYLLGQLGVIGGLSKRAPRESVCRGQRIHSGESYMVHVCSREGLRKLQLLWRKAPSAEAYDLRIACERTRVSYEWISGSLAGLPIREIKVQPYDGLVYEVSVASEGSFFAGTGGLLLAGR